MTPTNPVLDIQETEYPSLVRRFQASFIDGILSFILVGSLMAFANTIDEHSGWVKVVALIIGLSYEPLMTRYAYTIGQRITGMRVISADTGELTLYDTYLRYIVKFALGWISFLTIHSNPHKRAIHDFAAGTVMIRA